MFSEPDSILLVIERIVNKVMERRTYMQTTKKGEQLLENVKDFAVLH
jgi:predicted transcriptional regulator